MSFQVIPEPDSGPPPGPVVFTQEQIRCLEEATIFQPESQPNASTNTSLSQIHRPLRATKYATRHITLSLVYIARQ
ncbi:hypothetical protein ACN38_g2211 [Penicillium nordicum]|uniref:Uncharacterized protein n=1 Tax=Penicillium nordicum TaxID=229535 RepID=A0A0M8PAG4_9EURO|nr:hypothetical protein ACN38_g2211 [Penicillium nordicum]